MSAVRHIPRARDERVLRMLALRTGGMSTVEIGLRLGVTQQTVAAATNGVLEHDMATPDPGASPAMIRRHYWPETDQSRRARKKGMRG